MSHLTSCGHGFQSGDIVRIMGVRRMLDGDYVVSKTSEATFTIRPDTWYWRLWGFLKRDWREMRKVRY